MAKFEHEISGSPIFQCWNSNKKEIIQFFEINAEVKSGNFSTGETLSTQHTRRTHLAFRVTLALALQFQKGENNCFVFVLIIKKNQWCFFVYYRTIKKAQRMFGQPSSANEQDSLRGANHNFFLGIRANFACTFKNPKSIEMELSLSSSTYEQDQETDWRPLLWREAVRLSRSFTKAKLRLRGLQMPIDGSRSMSVFVVFRVWGRRWSLHL